MELLYLAYSKNVRKKWKTNRGLRMMKIRDFAAKQKQTDRALGSEEQQPSLEMLRPCQWGLDGSLLPWKLFAYLGDFGPVYPRPDNISSEKTYVIPQNNWKFYSLSSKEAQDGIWWWLWVKGTDVIIRYTYLVYTYWLSVQCVKSCARWQGWVYKNASN